MNITSENIRACQKNNRKAQELIYKELYVPMVRIAFRYLNCMDLAKEIFNSVMYKVFDRIEQFHGPENQFPSWVKRSIINACLDYLKINKRRKLHEQSAALTSDVLDFDTTNEVQELLLKAIEQLPKIQAQIFLLVAVDGYSHEQSAELLNISVSNSKYLLHQSRKQIQEILTLNDLKT